MGWGCSLKMLPKLPQCSAHTSTKALLSLGTPVVSPKAIHTGGSSGPITYSILSGNEKGTFSIQPSTGKGQEQGALEDRFLGALLFGPAEIRLKRGCPAVVSLRDRGARASKRSVSDPFCLPPGAITVRSAEGLDFEANPRLRLVLQAESGGAYAFSVLTLTLQDANDNAPRFLQPHYVAFLPESRLLEGPLLQVWGVIGRWGQGWADFVCHQASASSLLLPPGGSR